MQRLYNILVLLCFVAIFTVCAQLASGTSVAQAAPPSGGESGQSVSDMQAPELLEDFLQTPSPLANIHNLRLSGEQVIHLEVAGNYSAASFGSFCIELLKATLEDWSEGRIKLTHYSDSVLGNDKDIFKAVQFGSVAMGLMTSAPQAEFIPELAVFDMGGYPVDYYAAGKTMRNGPFRDAVNAIYNRAGLELVGLFPTSFRVLASTFPVRTFDDLAKLRIRVMENPYHAEFWHYMGADATQMPMSSSYISLQQGLLNAVENPVDTLLTNGVHEQAKYFTETDHILFNNTIICNQDIWKSLPDTYRDMVIQAVLRVSDWAAVNGSLRTKASIEKLKALGCEIILFSEEDRARMREAAAPLYENIRKAAGNELVDLWLSELKKNGSGQ